jgi:protein-tyrosine kinase
MSRIHEALLKAQQEQREGGADASSILQENWQEPVAAAPQSVAVAPVAAAAAATAPALAYKKVKWQPDRAKLACYIADRDLRLVGVEQYRSIRSKLFTLRDKKPLKTVLITSSVPNEGKTFTSANLAQVTAQAYNTKVLLIGGDLRNPGLHNVLGAPNEIGLTNYLQGQCEVDDLIHQGEPDNLYFVPSGPSTQEAAELLTNGRFAALMQHVLPKFDWIFIDSPPLLPITDALMISKYCDGVLMVVRAGMVDADQAKKALAELKGRPLLGVVLNGIDQGKAYDYYYSNYLPSPGK